MDSRSPSYLDLVGRCRYGKGGKWL